VTASRAVERAPVAVRLGQVGIVIIGRNEGERLRRCFDSLPPKREAVVYVDSASTDDSVEQARKRGIEVVQLDMSVPFTAGRARNAGLRRLRELHPNVGFVQFLDGDCALAPGWVEAALAEMNCDEKYAVVFGRRRERLRQASIYNRLCDMEWDTPVGESEACGGDAFVRMGPLLAAEGYDARLIAGEEPELCQRLRAHGWKIQRIGAEMTMHDAGMTRLGQWWRRSERSGHAYAEINSMHPDVWHRETRSALYWALLLPAATLASIAFIGYFGLILLAGYPALWLRTYMRRRPFCDSGSDARLYAFFCVLAKFPELAGMMRFWWNRGRGRRSLLIEYK
jgi:glycosyltransferase involved in cell wall biosynthesis